jgi:hypothetical protein
VSPSLSDLPVRKVTRALESVGFTYVRTKGSEAVGPGRADALAVEGFGLSDSDLGSPGEDFWPAGPADA